jgi:hypothetical protein
VTLIAVDKMTDAHWDILDAADAIVFGSPTYMGNVSRPFRHSQSRQDGVASTAPGETR